jgi:hypothetical protein
LDEGQVKNVWVQRKQQSVLLVFIQGQGQLEKWKREKRFPPKLLLVEQKKIVEKTKKIKSSFYQVREGGVDQTFMVGKFLRFKFFL